MEPKPFETLESLELYRLAREFRKSMYGVGRQLPEFERYGLASQIRRAAVSLTNNIAEGHGRYYYKDQLHFPTMARGSLQELVDDLNVCLDEGYLTPEAVNNLKMAGMRVQQVLNGYARHLRQKASPGTTVKEDSAPYMHSTPDVLGDEKDWFGG